MKAISDKIWETRKSRINQEKRLLHYATISEFIIPWYSIVLIAITINPFPQRKEIANYSSIIGSIIILVVSIIISSKDFKLRAKEVKSIYIQLDKLYHQAKSIELLRGDINEVFVEYSSILDNTENHSTDDYMKLRIDCWHRYIKNKNAYSDSIDLPTILEITLYTINRIARSLLLLFLFLGIPILFFTYITL